MTGDCFSATSRFTGFVSANGGILSVAPDTYLQLYVRSPADYSTTARVKVTIGGIERFYDMKTRALDNTPENLGTFRDVTDAAPNATVTSEAIRVADIMDPMSLTLFVAGSANATTKAFNCSATSGTNGSCHINVYSTATAGGAAISVSNEQYIVLQTKAAATLDTDVVVTVNVGGEIRTWTVRTAAQ